ncbi:Endoplasmin [Glycine max]|nr:Endoplasmin [Glycine max]KAH1197447.1 Endoplasmin [Glycine max]
MFQVNAEGDSDELVDPLKVEDKIGVVPHDLSTDSDVVKRVSFSSSGCGKNLQMEEMKVDSDLLNQLKRRLHALTIASATCFMFPIAMKDMIIGSSSESDSNTKLPFSTWAFLSTILFGNIVIFYADSIAEERLHLVFSSPRHLAAARIYEATSLEHNRKDSIQNSDLSNGEFDDEQSQS